MDHYTMVVEQTRAYKRRMRYDPETGRFCETDAISLGAARNFLYPYGWIKESGTPPQPHWDVMLMSDGIYEPGNEVAIRIIGVFLRADGDNKFVAVEQTRAVYDISELNADETDALHKLYPRVGEGEGWFGSAEAGRTMATGHKAL